MTFNPDLVKKERNDKVVALYRGGGYSYNSLAKVFKVAPQRIQQIVKKAEYREEQNEA